MLTVGVLVAVSGCSGGTPGSGADPGLWWFLSIALLVVAGLAFALGRMQARAAQAKTLASLRAAQHAWQQCLGSASWQTDRQHHFRAADGQMPAPWAADPAFEQVLQTQCAFVDVRVAAINTDPEGTAQHKVWSIQGQPMLDSAGEFAGFVGIARQQAADDVAAVKTPSPAEPPAAPATNAIASEESDSFSFTVSHDLRAPIRVVEGFTRIVKEDYGHLLDRVGNDHLDRVMGAAARMNLMIDALLTLARLSRQPLARQPVNLSQMASFVIEELRRTQPEREVEVFVQDGLEAVGDPTLLRLVLENLLGNAWKYSARTTMAQISLRAVPHGKTVAYVVRDNGAGFDMRAADRLFGLFQRLHSASEFAGHGVGLASVKRIVQRHGGDIWAESEPARGAAFSFTLDR